MKMADVEIFGKYTSHVGIKRTTASRDQIKSTMSGKQGLRE